MNISQETLIKLAKTFAFAFLASLLVGLSGLIYVHSLSAAKAVAFAAVIAALSAGAHAVEHSFKVTTKKRRARKR